ncbi:MAG TPA: outer membrane protein assembly factor BamD [Polyangiaceae bacterium]|jgi:outer membrane protein assembly factor BamD
MRRRASLVLTLAVAALSAACENEPAKTALGYTEDAKRAYDTAMEQYQAHAWIEAQTMFREVKRKYSYSKWARQAELRIADADYEQEKYPEAIHEYKDFIHAHRAENDDVAYARARIAEATYAQIPESFLMPAAEERDQGTVVDAYKEFKSFLADYPDSKQTPHVRDLISQVIGRLVRHELYVARYYLNRENYDATIARIQYALKNYAGELERLRAADGAPSNLEGEALLLLGQTYLRMHKWSDARQAFESVVQGDPRSPIIVQARGYLEFLKQRGG